MNLDIWTRRRNNIGPVEGLPPRPLRPGQCTALHRVSIVNLSITVEQPDKKLALFGSADRYLRMIRDTFGVQLVSRDDEIKISGDGEQVSKAAAVLEQMQKKLRRQDWLSVEDVGTAIHPSYVEGQIQGGIVQGVGQALWEQVRYEEGSGQLMTGSLMDYCAPRADQLPPLRASFDESVPCKTNLLGVKGCGELGTIGSVPAVVHAVLDALDVPHLEMPLTAERVWRALRRER